MQTNSSNLRERSHLDTPLLLTMVMGICIFYSLAFMIIYPLDEDFILFITAN